MLDNQNNEVVTYSYDVWGKIIGIGGNEATTLGNLNSFRYRRYYYDNETGLYFYRVDIIIQNGAGSLTRMIY